MEEGMKKCPACAEEIKTEAKKCRYCSEDFTLTEKDRIPETIQKVKSFQKSINIRCKKCNYSGKAIHVKKGSSFITLLLLLCGFIPGIIYSIWRGGYNWGCPNCKNIFIQKLD